MNFDFVLACFIFLNFQGQALGGILTKIITSTSISKPYAVYADKNGNVFVAGASTYVYPSYRNYITKITANGTAVQFLDTYPLMYNPNGIFAIFGDSNNNMYYSDGLYCVYKSTPQGYSLNRQCTYGTTYRTWVNDGFPASSTGLNTPRGLFIDSGGVMYVSDSGFCVIRKMTLPNGAVSTLVGSNGFTSGYCSYTTSGFSGVNTHIAYPYGLWMNSGGDLLWAEYGSCFIRKLSKQTGIVSTVAGIGSNGYRGDGVPATSTTLNNPYSLVLDSNGNVYIGDIGNDYRVRKVLTNGIITTYVGTGTFGNPTYTGIDATNVAIGSQVFGLAVDSTGKVFVADNTYSKILVVGYSNPTVSPTFAPTHPTMRPTEPPKLVTSMTIGDIFGIVTSFIGTLVLIYVGCIGAKYAYHKYPAVQSVGDSIMEVVRNCREYISMRFPAVIEGIDNAGIAVYTAVRNLQQQGVDTAVDDEDVELTNLSVHSIESAEEERRDIVQPISWNPMQVGPRPTGASVLSVD